MRRILATAALALSVLTATGTATAAQSGLHLVPLGAPFPARAFSLALPQRMLLTAANVHVTENGSPVNAPSVIPASELGHLRLGVVLAIDASNSMRGRSIADALAAAQTFTTHMAANEQLAVLAFNRDPHIIQGFSSDAQTVSSTLRTTPALGQGTHIYDAVKRAIDVIHSSGFPTGAVVVVSDGADTGSTTDLSTLASLAGRSHVRVYTVGIRSSSFRAAPLKSLAADTSGSFAIAGTSKELPKIYDRLGSELADQYVIRYRSTAAPRQPVQVEVRIDGVPGTVTSSYTAPPLPPTPPAFERPLSLTFWGSTVSFVLAICAVAVLIATALAVMLRPRSPTVRARMSAFVSMPTQPQRERSSPLLSRALSGADRSLGKTGWWATFKVMLEIAEIRTSAIRLVAASLVGGLLVAAICAVITPFATPAGLVVPFTMWMVVTRRVEKKREAFADQLPDNLQVLASALRAGHSLVGALSVVVDDCAEPARSEFRRVIADEQLGVPLDEALNVVVERMASRDLAQVALVAALQRQTGGNTAEVLDRVTETVRDRFKLRGLIKTLTAQGRISRWIVTALPVLLTSAILFINPHYFDPLIGRAVGRLLIAFAVLMVIVGSLVIRRIVNIKL